MKLNELIVLVAPNRNEDWTQYIAYKVAEKTGVLYTIDDSIISPNYILVLELGGIYDRGEWDIAIEDMTKSQIFKKVLDFYFDTEDVSKMEHTFKTPLAKLFSEIKSNYVRLELTNKIRYNNESRELLILVLSEIISNVLKTLGGENE